jgi:hypothetical protein
MPDRIVRTIAARAVALGDRYPNVGPLELLDAAMRGHELTDLNLRFLPAPLRELVIEASQDSSLFLPEMPPADFLRLRYGLRPDEPVRGEHEWRDRCALVLQANADAWPPGDREVRDGIDELTAALHAAHGADGSPERVARTIVVARRASNLQ